jgi:hypothetical protein
MLPCCRTLVPVSVVSIWRIVVVGESNGQIAHAATLQYVAVGVPPGLQLKHLASVTLPLLNTISGTPRWSSSGMLISMPYVGEVDLRQNSDPSNVALTAVTSGFVVRGTVSPWEALSWWSILVHTLQGVEIHMRFGHVTDTPTFTDVHD